MRIYYISSLSLSLVPRATQLKSVFGSCYGAKRNKHHDSIWIWERVAVNTAACYVEYVREAYLVLY